MRSKLPTTRLRRGKRQTHIRSCRVPGRAIRGVAQLVSAPRSGRGGRKFESSHPDNMQIKPVSDTLTGFICLLTGFICLYAPPNPTQNSGGGAFLGPAPHYTIVEQRAPGICLSICLSISLSDRGRQAPRDEPGGRGATGAEPPSRPRGQTSLPHRPIHSRRHRAISCR